MRAPPGSVSQDIQTIVLLGAVAPAAARNQSATEAQRRERRGGPDLGGNALVAQPENSP